MGARLGLDTDNHEQWGLSGLFGSSCSITDKFKRKQIAVSISRYLTLADKRMLVSLAESNVQPTAQAMARFFLGGKDCKHKNVAPGDQQFLDRLPTLLEQRANEMEQQKSQADGQKEPPTESAKESNIPTEQPVKQPAAEEKEFLTLTDDQKTYVLIGTGLFILAGTAILVKK